VGLTSCKYKKPSEHRKEAWQTGKYTPKAINTASKIALADIGGGASELGGSFSLDIVMRSNSRAMGGRA
jgi:hypothetical protein